MNRFTYNDIREFISNYLDEKLRAQGRFQSGDISDDCDLLLSGLIDSLGLLELLTAINVHCGREIDYEALDTEQMTIVGPLCRFVSEQTEKK